MTFALSAKVIPQYSLRDLLLQLEKKIPRCIPWDDEGKEANH